MKKIKKILLVGAALSLSVTSCSLEEVGSLNGPTLNNILKSSTRGDIQDLVGGIVSNMRIRLGTYYDDVGVIGREFYRFSSSDPRFVRELLGENKAQLDNSSFLITGPWSARYGTVKSANILLEAIANTEPAYSETELNGIKGFAKTIQAYELLLNLNLTYSNGIRLDVKDPQKLGAFLDYNASLTAILTMLDEAADDLSNAGDDFAFNFGSKETTGFKGFTEPNTFKEFNRAITARVAIYADNKVKAREALSESFLDLSPENLNNGVYYKFSTNGADILNPVYFPKNASEAGARVVHPSFLADAESNDSRVSEKTAFREIFDKTENKFVPSPLTVSGLTGTHDFWVYKTNVAEIPIIRNEELILIYAEANIGANQAEADKAINIIREAANLSTDKAGVTIDDVLRERRYSLFGEGHRWIDMRRYDKLNELPIDRLADNSDPDNPIEADDVWEKFPVPATENQ